MSLATYRHRDCDHVHLTTPSAGRCGGSRQVVRRDGEPMNRGERKALKDADLTLADEMMRWNPGDEAHFFGT